MERRTGFEPATFALARRRSTTEPPPHKINGGSYRARTYDLLLVRQMLSQLSYAPIRLPATCILYHKVFGLSSLFFKFFYFFLHFFFSSVFLLLLTTFLLFFRPFSGHPQNSLRFLLKSLYKKGGI